MRNDSESSCRRRDLAVCGVRRNPQWTPLPVRFRDVNTPDRAGLPRRPLTVNIHRQCRLGRGGQRPLPVNTRRHASCIALRDPPHADQRVGARAEHQLLQIADPLKVPHLRRREDPLTQTPYVILSGAPVHSVPLQHNVLRSVHHDGAPNDGSHSLPHHGAQLALRFRSHAHRCFTDSPNPRQHPFGSGIRPYPAGYAGRPVKDRSQRLGFPLPFSRRHLLLGLSYARWGSRPSSRSAYRTATGPDLNGVITFHLYETRPGRVPPQPRERRCSHDRINASGRRLPLLNGQFLHPGTATITRGSF